MTRSNPVVIVVARYPGAPRDGGNLHVYNVARELAAEFSFHFVCWNPSDAVVATAETRALADELHAATLTILPLNPKMSPRERVRHLGNAAPPGCAYFNFHIGAALRAHVKDLVQLHDPVALHVWGPALGGCLCGMKAPRRICTVGDSFSLVHRSYSSVSNPARRLYHKHVEQKFRRHEKKILQSFDTVVAFTERDAASIEAGGGRVCKVIPNGVDERIFFPRTRPENPMPVLSFHGLLDFHPNAAAARYIVEELGPALEARLGPNGFKVQIIGAQASAALRSAASVRPWLSLPGFVDDLPQMLSTSDVYLAPIFSGAGIKNKVLEAMSLGLPVVGTAEAFAALKVVDGVHCVLADRAQFADAVVACLNAREARSEIGREAAQFVDQQYRWSRVGASYGRLYLGTARNAECGMRQ